MTLANSHIRQTSAFVL